MGILLIASIALIIVLLMPIILAIGLFFYLKKYRLNLWPTSYLCYTNIKLVIPCNECLSIVITLRHFSISLHRELPYITFRLRGLNLNIIQYNLFKDPNCNNYLTDLKTRFTRYIEEMPPENIKKAYNQRPMKGFLSQRLFEKVEGFIEDIAIKLIDVKSKEAMDAAIEQTYTLAQRESEVKAYNVQIPLTQITFAFIDTKLTGVMCIPIVVLCYGDNPIKSTIENTVVKITSGDKVNIGILCETSKINSSFVELKKIISFFIDNTNYDSIFRSYEKYCFLSRIKEGSFNVLPSLLETISLKIEQITGNINGRREDLKLELAVFSMEYRYSKEQVDVLYN